MKRWWLFVLVASALVFVLTTVVQLRLVGPGAVLNLDAPWVNALMSALVVLVTGTLLGVWRMPPSGRAPHDEILQHTNGAIITTDGRGNIRFWNAGAERLFGFSQAQIQDRSILSLLAPPYRDQAAALLGADGKEPSGELETRALRSNGEEFDLQLSVSTYGQTKSPPGLVWYGRDISARKHLERTIRQVLDASYGRNATEFLHFLTEQLATTLGTRYAFISQLNADGDTAHMMSMWDRDHFDAPFDYALSATPCAALRTRDLVCYADQVAERFPRDGFLRQHDVHAYLAVALFDARGNPMGHMGVMDCVPLKSVEFSATVLRLFSSRAASELQRVRADESIAHRVAMEALLADLSSSFIGVHSTDFDQRVRQALRQLGEFAEVQRCHLYRLSADRNSATLTYLWCAPGTETVPDSYRQVDTAAFPWHRDQLRSRGFVLIPDVDALPDEAAAERSALKHGGVRSMLEVGMYDGGRLIGFLGLESLQRVIRWPPEDLRLLRVVGEVLVSAFERRKSELTLRKLSSALDQAADAVMITDRQGVIEYVNPAFSQITGYSRAEALGQKPSLLRSTMHDTAFYRELWTSVLRGEVFRGTVINRRRDGSLYHEEKTIAPLKDQTGTVTHFISTGRDISQRVQAQEHLMHLAHHDTLTDLPNRSLFMDRIQHAITRARRNGDHVGVLFLDLDGFKEINDSLGHDAGDHLLQLVADRLRAAVRQGDTVSRLGGDEFTILIEGIERPDDAAAVAAKIVDSLAQPFSIVGAVRRVSASMGISMYPADGEEPEQLLTRADQAMFEAKRDSIKGGYRFATSGTPRDGA